MAGADLPSIDGVVGAYLLWFTALNGTAGGHVWAVLGAERKVEALAALGRVAVLTWQRSTPWLIESNLQQLDDVEEVRGCLLVVLRALITVQESPAMGHIDTARVELAIESTEDEFLNNNGRLLLAWRRIDEARGDLLRCDIALGIGFAQGLGYFMLPGKVHPRGFDPLFFTRVEAWKAWAKDTGIAARMQAKHGLTWQI